eukprot:2022058-Prymnesium_polylepis.1
MAVDKTFAHLLVDHMNRVPLHMNRTWWQGHPTSDRGGVRGNVQLENMAQGATNTWWSLLLRESLSDALARPSQLIIWEFAMND